MYLASCDILQIIDIRARIITLSQNVSYRYRPNRQTRREYNTVCWRLKVLSFAHKIMISEFKKR